jgi:transposase
VFPKEEIDAIKQQDGRDLTRFDIDFDLPERCRKVCASSRHLGRDVGAARLEWRPVWMAKPYSEDLRARIVGTGQDGATIPETAEQLGVSISSVVRFRRLHRETGSISPAKFGGYKGYALATHEELVRQLVAEQPDITLAELKALLAKEKVTVGQSSISRFLHHLNLRFKKKSAGRRAGPTGRRRRT